MMTILSHIASRASCTVFALCILVCTSMVSLNTRANANSWINPGNQLHFVQQSSLSGSDYFSDSSQQAELSQQRSLEIDVLIAVLKLHEIAGAQWQINLMLDVSAVVEQVNQTSQQLQRVVNYDIYILPGERERAEQIENLRELITEQWKEYFSLSTASRERALIVIQPSLLEAPHVLHQSLCTQTAILVSNKPEAVLCQ